MSKLFHWPGGIPEHIRPHPTADLSLDDLKDEVKGGLFFVQVSFSTITIYTRTINLHYARKAGFPALVPGSATMMQNTSYASVGRLLNNGLLHRRISVMHITTALQLGSPVQKVEDHHGSQLRGFDTHPSHWSVSSRFANQLTRVESSHLYLLMMRTVSTAHGG